MPAPYEHAVTWPNYKGASAFLAKLRAEAARPGSGGALPSTRWLSGRAPGSCSIGGSAGPDGPLEVLLAHPGRTVLREARPRRLDDPEGRARRRRDRPADRRAARVRGGDRHRDRPGGADHRARVDRPEGRQGRPRLGGRGRPGSRDRALERVRGGVAAASRATRVRFPEIDRVAWFDLDEARRRVKPTQVAVDRSARGGAPRLTLASSRWRSRCADVGLCRRRPRDAYGVVAAETVTRTRVGSAPEATSEPRSGVTMSSSNR